MCQPMCFQSHTYRAVATNTTWRLPCIGMASVRVAEESGLSAEDMCGYVQTYGYVHDLDHSGRSAGDMGV
jgi:hypothetical protein